MAMDEGGPGAIQRVRHDSPLGQWCVEMRPPRADLAGLVELLWYGEGRVNYLRDRILPSGGAYLLINLGPTQYRVDAGPPERRVAFDDVWYSGPHTVPIDTEAPHGNALLGVSLRPSGTHGWAHARADALADRTLSLSDVVGDAGHRLRERLFDCRDSATRFGVVEDWLAARLRPRSGTHAAVSWALARLTASSGQLPIERLAREVGFTRKHLAALFGEQVGLAPKAFARVQRFRSALALLDGREAVPWSDLAARCGYFDQAHLSRDFRAFCGFSPGEFLRHARADSNSIVLR
jgi:AraC-like DNA-binding protein